MAKVSARQVVASTQAKQASPPINHRQVLEEILKKLTPLDFSSLAKKAKFAGNLKQKHEIVLVVDELLKTIKKHKYALARRDDFIFVYNQRFWAEVAQEVVKTFLVEAAKAFGVNQLESSHYGYRERLFQQFLATAYFESVEPPADVVLINLQNGTYEIGPRTRRLRTPRASDGLTYQLSFSHNPAAECSLFREFLKRVLPEEELQQILAEYAAYVFTKNLRLEKALLLFGSGANGKSVIFHVFNALLGKENVTNFSLSDLLQEHNRAQIANKLLNYGSEINATTTKDIFKNLVSNEPIQARLKFGNSFLMRDYAKLCFNANELPRDIELNDSYFRRLIVIPFRVRIPDHEQDAELADKIIRDELSGVFNWVLEGLERLLKNKRFTASEIVKNTIAEYRRDADSVASFLDEEGPQKGQLKDVYACYRTYCLESGFRPLGKKNFKQRLLAQGYASEPGTGNQTTVFLKQDS